MVHCKSVPNYSRDHSEETVESGGVRSSVVVQGNLYVRESRIFNLGYLSSISYEYGKKH